ncbi:MAG: class I tRNA ligase family protein, partial [Microgenomates group bacterium]
MKVAYQPQKIEEKWKKIWEKEGINKFVFDTKKKKFYVLVELPYTSGDLHIGHWFAFTTPDVISRYKRMQGYNVFFPIGFDAFGLPAENAAIKRGIHPKDWTMKNIKTMTKQFSYMGTMINNWDKVVITCLPQYYRFNQWIFIQMFKKGLIYQGKALSNWCPSCQTVLANENVVEGKCWRCDSQVEQKQVPQWFIKITAYAEKLLWKENPQVDWPQSVREGQNNWIGKSEGAEIEFKIKNSNLKIKVFTTRVDTLFGVTALVL